MATTAATRLADARWPRWTWIVLPALAIAIGGSAGYIAGGADPEPRTAPAPAQVRPTAEPIAAPAQPAAQPDPEIEVEPDPEPAGTAKPSAHGIVRPAGKAKPPHKTKPLKTTPCNVYDHMDGC